MAKIDVIIPVYNTSIYLKKCLDSVLNQTFKDVKIIAIDDKSTDNSLKILLDYQKKFPNNIMVITNKENLGAALARNVGLNVADSNYVTFLDSDDFLEHNLFEKINQIINDYHPDIISCNTKFNLGGINANFLGMKRINPTKDQLINFGDCKDIIYKQRPSVTSKFINRELINTNFPNLKWEDYAFIVPYLVKSNSTYILSDIGYFYNINPFGTTTRDTFKYSSKVLDIFTCSDIINQNIDENLKEKFNKELNITRTMNCLQRLRDLSFACNISHSDKIKLANLIANLIKVREGDYHQLEWYQHQMNNSKFYSYRMNIVEKMLDPNLQNDFDEENIKGKIKLLTKKYNKN